MKHRGLLQHHVSNDASSCRTEEPHEGSRGVCMISCWGGGMFSFPSSFFLSNLPSTLCFPSCRAGGFEVEMTVILVDVVHL